MSSFGEQLWAVSVSAINLALQALVATFAANKTMVDESAARAAVTEVAAE